MFENLTFFYKKFFLNSRTIDLYVLNFITATSWQPTFQNIYMIEYVNILKNQKILFKFTCGIKLSLDKRVPENN